MLLKTCTFTTYNHRFYKVLIHIRSRQTFAYTNSLHIYDCVLSKFKDSQRAVWLPLLLCKMFALWCLQRAFVLGLELCPAY